VKRPRDESLPVFNESLVDVRNGELAIGARKLRDDLGYPSNYLRIVNRDPATGRSCSASMCAGVAGVSSTATERERPDVDCVSNAGRRAVEVALDGGGLAFNFENHVCSEQKMQWGT